MTVAISQNLVQEKAYAAGLARAFGGALIFAFPLLMTMEMWALGAAVEPVRLIAFVILALPFIYGLSEYAGFNAQRGWRHDGLNTFSALAVGFTTSLVLLSVFGVLGPDTGFTEGVSRVTLQAIPAAIGATLARRQLSSGADEGDEDKAPYSGELFLMAAGAVVLAFNVAPTEEVILIAWQTATWQILILAIASIALLHVLVFSVGFAGQEDAANPGSALFHFTLAGYGIALVISLFILWVFGRTDDLALPTLVATMVVLGFPASLGAAAARLLV